MAEKLGLGNEVRQLKIGQSFTNPKSSAFHTIKYDFKPASVDTNKIASVDVARNNEVTVTVPHLDGAGVPQTVFKGNHRPYQKECVLIIDRVTGEITLEKLACNMQVKKTRSESAKVPLPQDRLSDRSGSGANSLASRSQTPPVGTRTSSKTKVTSGKSRRHDRIITQIVPKHSPLHASPGYPSPSHHKSPKRDILHETHTPNNNSSALASLPMIGIDDFDMAPQSSSANTTMNAPSSQQQQHQIHNNHNHMPPPSTTDRSPPVSVRLTPPESRGEVGEITDTSSSSSESDSDSDPDRTVVAAAAGRSGSSFSKTNGHHPPNGNTAPPSSSSSNNQAKLATHLLNEDLCLSESGSDSD